jgi:hypothetical protein
MSEFKVGEVAILCNLAFSTDLNGTEVTILSERIDDVEMDLIDTGGTRIVSGYYIGGLEAMGVSFAEERQLRKKRPPQETTTWDRCVWQPSGVTA